MFVLVMAADPGMVTQLLEIPTASELVCVWSNHPEFVGHARLKVLPEMLNWILPGFGLMVPGGVTVATVMEPLTLI